MSQNLKILLLSASAGAGHVRAAEALQKAFLSKAARNNIQIQIRHIDALQYTTKIFRKIYSQIYIEMVGKIPEVPGWLYDRFDTPWKGERRRLLFDKLNTRPFVKLLEEENPDLIVCTHFLPAEIVSWLKAKNRLSAKHAIVITDFDVHAMWLCHHYDVYFVANAEARAYLTGLGIPSEKVEVSGIPIDPSFAIPKNKVAMQQKHGLLQNCATVLLSAGGYGVGSIEEILTALQPIHTPCQVIAICGKNVELLQKVKMIAKKTNSISHLHIHPMGYTSQMDELMAASDMVLGKPGGLTTSESLASHLVMAIVNPIPGQEERNSDFLLESGAAIRCNNMPTLAYKIDQILGNRERLITMQNNAKAISHPNAADQIADSLLNKIK